MPTETAVPQQVQDAADNADALIAAQSAALSGNEQPPKEADPMPPQDQDPPKEPEHTDEIADLKHQLSVLQGKYNAEIKALGDDPNTLNTLKAEVKQIRRQNTDLQRIISDQQNQLAEKVIPAKEEPEPKEPVKVTTELNEDDLAHLKSEGLEGKTLEIFNKLIDQRADQIAEKRYGKVSDELKSIKKDVVVTKEDDFFQALTSAVPNWRVINGTQETPNDDWLDWLDDTVRTEGLHSAQERGDVAACIKIFKQYEKEKGLAKEPPVVIEPEPPKVEEPVKIDPAKLVEPASVPAGQLPKDAPTYTMAEYKKHYNDFTKSTIWRGREEEWQKKTDILDKAFREGRVN